jgi:hypothetical protein
MRNLGQTLIITGGIMMIVGLIGIIIKHSTEKEHFLVKDNYGHAYITNYIHYMGDCIVFYDDENDTEHKLCNDYKIIKI